MSERLSVCLSSRVSFQFLVEIMFLGKKYILIKLVKCPPIPNINVLFWDYRYMCMCMYVYSGLQWCDTSFSLIHGEFD